MPSYPSDAACARSDLPAHTWDAEVAGETERQQQARHNAAAAVCVTCPVMDTCEARRDEGGGMRAGIVRPDKIPGWTLGESNSWLGWSRLSHDLHGNEAGLRRHYRDGEKPCRSCYAWQRRDAKDTRNRAA